MNADAKKTVLRMTPYGIYVLTADDGNGNISAWTVNWVTQSAFGPPLVVVTRFAGLACLPTGVPDKAADELERRVRDGFKGAIVNGHNRSRYLDDQFYWPILDRAEALAAPIYLHPTRPPQAVIDASFGGFAPDASCSPARAGAGTSRPPCTSSA